MGNYNIVTNDIYNYLLMMLLPLNYNVNPTKKYKMIHCCNYNVMAETQIKKKKVTLNVTISPYLKRKIDALVETEEFSSASDLTTTAITEFLLKHDMEQEEIGAVEILIELLQTEYGRKAINAILSQQKKSSKKIPVPERKNNKEEEYMGEGIVE